MLPITLLCVGTPRSGWTQEGIQQYADRLKHDVQLDIVSLPASKEKDTQRQRENESQRILDALSKRDSETWLLDEYGKSMTSVAFADAVQCAQDQGKPLTFILGGAYGVTDDVRAAVHHSLRLSDMTLPHELCQVLFLEQLYRAVHIKKGTGYHH